MARRGGWRRRGSRGRFRYIDARGRRIAGAGKLERIDELKIPPAWRDVWISPSPGAKLQATGLDSAGRRQYLYHPKFREAQEEAKFESLIRFGERGRRWLGTWSSGGWIRTASAPSPSA